MGEEKEESPERPRKSKLSEKCLDIAFSGLGIAFIGAVVLAEIVYQVPCYVARTILYDIP